MYPTLLYSGATIVAAGTAGLFYLLRIRVDHRLSQEEVSFLRHWGIGFFLFALTHAPAFFINLGITVISATFLQIVYSSVFIAITAANLLFLRGLFILQRKSRFWTVKFPITLFIVVSVLNLGLFLTIGNQAIPFLLTFNILIFQIPIHLYFAITFIKLGKKLPAYHSGFMILAIAWFLVIALDLIIWRLIINFPTDFWVIKLISLKKWYVARAITHLLLLAGLLKCWQVCKSQIHHQGFSKTGIVK